MDTHIRGYPKNQRRLFFVTINQWAWQRPSQCCLFFCIAPPMMTVGSLKY